MNAERPTILIRTQSKPSTDLITESCQTLCPESPACLVELRNGNTVTITGSSLESQQEWEGLIMNLGRTTSLLLALEDDGYLSKSSLQQLSPKDMPGQTSPPLGRSQSSPRHICTWYLISEKLGITTPGASRV